MDLDPDQFGAAVVFSAITASVIVWFVIMIRSELDRDKNGPYY